MLAFGLFKIQPKVSGGWGADTKVRDAGMDELFLAFQ